MLTAKARLHIQNHNEPDGRAIIAGERAALKALGQALTKAGNSVLGLEQVELYTSDGHKYQILITCDVDEEEWQALPLPYDKKHDLNNLSIVKQFDEVKSTSTSGK